MLWFLISSSLIKICVSSISSISSYFFQRGKGSCPSCPRASIRSNFSSWMRGSRASWMPASIKAGDVTYIHVRLGIPCCQWNILKYRKILCGFHLKTKKNGRKWMANAINDQQRSANISNKALRKANDSRRSRQLSPWGPPNKVRLHRKGPSPSAWHLTAGHEALKVYDFRPEPGFYQ